MDSHEAGPSRKRKRDHTDDAPTENSPKPSHKSSRDLSRNVMEIAAPSAPQYAAAYYLSDRQKTLTLRHMLDTCLTQPAVSSSAVTSLQVHVCTWSCVILSVDAQAAGQLGADHGTLVPIDRLQQPTQSSTVRPPAPKRRRQKATRHIPIAETHEQGSANSWLSVESEVSLQQVRHTTPCRRSSHSYIFP
ncbi:hypothetical protein DFH06DRAFT_607868 [Mycena polygramma]|nr:hypothetical protein DFH06DRAFT_607868 [Mycena polygramma]